MFFFFLNNWFAWNDASPGRILFSRIPLRNSLISVSNHWRAVWAGTVPFKGHHHCLGVYYTTPTKSVLENDHFFSRVAASPSQRAKKTTNNGMHLSHWPDLLLPIRLPSQNYRQRCQTILTWLHFRAWSANASSLTSTFTLRARTQLSRIWWTGLLLSSVSEALPIWRWKAVPYSTGTAIQRVFSFSFSDRRNSIPPYNSQIHDEWQTQSA